MKPWRKDTTLHTWCKLRQNMLSEKLTMVLNLSGNLSVILKKIEAAGYKNVNVLTCPPKKVVHPLVSTPLKIGP